MIVDKQVEVGGSESGRDDASFSIDEQVGHLLRLAYQRASANLAIRLRPYGLTPVQFAVLMRLLEKGRLSQNELGRLVAMPPANIHGLVRRLAKRGLIATGDHPADQRLVVVSLSKQGQSLASTLTRIDLAATTDALAPLTQKEQSVFLRLLKKMV